MVIPSKNDLKQIMDKEKAIETNVSAIAPKEGTPVAVPTQADYEAKNALLEAEKAKLIEEKANYQLAYLKEKNKSKPDPDESEEDKMRRIANEAVANSRLAEIAREQDTLIKSALKENKELKLTQMNKSNGVPSAVGSHTEGGTVVTDTLITPEQLSAFKARGWTDKDIERYKKNLIKNTR